jgi:tripartite-type tricarboxylate transporter receptor subunit TctC
MTNMFNSMKAAVALVLVGTGSLAAVPAQAQAQYPNQAVKWVVPFSPGGLPDTVARIVGQKLQDRLGQSVVIENRPGAGGNVAAAAILGIPADGYTMMVTDGSMFTINPKLMKQLTYDADKDFVPVVQVARGPLFLAVHPKLPVSTFKEFIDYARANPGKINYGSSGLGTTHHLTMEAVKAALKLDMAHVPFKGTGQSVPALLGGHVDVAFSAYPSLAGAVQGKQVKLIATNGLKRSADAPDVPAISEFIPGFDFAPVIGVFAKAGTPKAAIDKIAAEVIAVMKMPEVVAQLAKVGVEPAPAGPDGYAKGLKEEAARVAATVKAANIQPQ